MRSARFALDPQLLRPAHRLATAGLSALLLPLLLATPTLARTADLLPAPPAVPATPGSGATADPTPSPAPQQKQQSELRISGPSGTVDPGPHTIGVRLLADGRAVDGGEVRLERRAGDRWEPLRRLVTRSDGLATTRLDLRTTTRLRAVHDGSDTRTAATSREIVVTVATFRQQAVRIASEQRGKPYRYGATGPDSFDCSGLVLYVFRQVGKELPRTSRDQFRATERISRSAKQPGDLIFTHRNGRIGHVGIYAGDGRFWVAPRSGDVVKLQRIYTSSYYVGRVR